MSKLEIIKVERAECFISFVVSSLKLLINNIKNFLYVFIANFNNVWYRPVGQIRC